LGQEEGEIRKNARARLLAQIGFLRRAAPNVIARIDWLHLGRNLLAHARADSIAADEEIGAFPFAAGEVHVDAGAVLLDALERITEVIMRLVDGREHEPLHPYPGGEDLRQMLLRDHPTAVIECDAFFDDDAEL